MNTDSGHSERPDPERSRIALEERLESLRDTGLAGSHGDLGHGSKETAFVDWMLGAARLAAMGHESLLRSWPSLATTLGIDVETAIFHAAASGITLLEAASGRRLGEQVGHAEDAACLAMVETRITNLLGDGPVPGWLDSWRRAASELPLDEEAAEIVLERRRCWPLPESIRLPVVDVPLTALDLQVIGATPMPPPVRLVPRFEHAEELATFDDGRPTPGMIRRFGERRGEGRTRRGAIMEADAELDPFWQVTVGLRAADVGIRSIRIGPLALTTHPDQVVSEDDVPGGSLWSASLHGLPLDVRTRIVCGDICIQTDEGDRFLL